MLLDELCTTTRFFVICICDTRRKMEVRKDFFSQCKKGENGDKAAKEMEDGVMCIVYIYICLCMVYRAYRERDNRLAKGAREKKKQKKNKKREKKERKKGKDRKEERKRKERRGGEEQLRMKKRRTL